MKVSRTELQTYFKDSIPSVEVLADAFTFHAFEIDGIEGEVLDVKVLPNRTADCSTAEGLARELAAILDLPLQGVGELSYDGQKAVEATTARLNAILGASFTHEEILNAFHRLGFRVEEEGEVLRVTAPRPRTDIVILEDLAEEVGQVLGYDRIPLLELPPTNAPVDQDRFRGIERMKDMLVGKGYIEISAQSFVATGDIELANPFDKTKPMLRTTLAGNMRDALARAKHHAPLVLAPCVKPRLFEVGTVFPASGEYLELQISEADLSLGYQKTSNNLSVANIEEFGRGYEPEKYTLGGYQAFSVYPFITRDVACWAPAGTAAATIEEILLKEASSLLVRVDQFDQFEKEGRVSYAFRLVFQSHERTLTDDEVNEVMSRVRTVLAREGFEVR